MCRASEIIDKNRHLGLFVVQFSTGWTYICNAMELSCSIILTGLNATEIKALASLRFGATKGTKFSLNERNSSQKNDTKL